MHLTEARKMALELMTLHGLAQWEFGFDGARRRLGACWLERRRITLSRHFVWLNGPEAIRDVILHEIAHALTPGDGHGPRFKALAAKLGCESSASVSERRVVAAPARVILSCPSCGRSWPRYRRPAVRLACRACSDGGRRVVPLEVRPPDPPPEESE